MVGVGSSKYGNGSCVVVSSASSISFSSGVSVNGEENSCQKFFGNESNGSPSRGFVTEKNKNKNYEKIVCISKNMGKLFFKIYRKLVGLVKK